jgi:uncharacterized damage-inducible protein DinB
MTTTEMLQAQFDLIYKTVEANTAGLSAEDSLAHPEAGGNCANWILGHLTNAQNGLMQLMGVEPVWTDAALERDWNEPVTGPDSALDFGAMRDAFLGSRERCLEAIGAQSAEALAEDGIPNPLGGTTTREGLIMLLAFHMAYHAGQLAVARRVAGHPGVFRQPEG